MPICTQEENMTEVQLFKPNEMVSFFAQLELNRTARHLFNYFLQHAQKKIKFENFQGDTFHINIKELNELANINPNTYDIVEKSLNHLMRPVVIRNDPHCYEAFVPVTYVKVNKKTGEYDFTLQRLVIDLLRQTDYFTKLELQEFNLFKSKFSLIILEFLKQYEKLKKIPEVSIDELRKITDTQKKFSMITMFKNKVIDVAVKEINESTNYNVSYELITKYTSRRPKVSAVQFYFSKKVLEATNSPTVEEAACSESDPLWVQEPVQEVQELTVDEAFGLFADFKRVFTDLTKEQYNLATYKYTYKTLNKFADSIAKYSKTYTTENFWQWLADRTAKLDFYQERVMQFEMLDVLNSFIANNQFKLQDQDVAQVRALVGAYGTLEYKDYVPQLAELYNMCFPKNTYNPFEKMLERMQ